MEKKPKTVTVDGITFEIPMDEFLCEECETTNYIYNDDLPPFHCNECGAKLKYVRSEPRVNGELDILA